MFRGNDTEAVEKTHEDYFKRLTTKKGAARDVFVQAAIQDGLAAIYLLLEERLPKPADTYQ